MYVCVLCTCEHVHAYMRVCVYRFVHIRVHAYSAHVSQSVCNWASGASPPSGSVGAIFHISSVRRRLNAHALHVRVSI